MTEDSKLWDIICDGPYVTTKVLEELPYSMAKTSKEYTDADKKAVEKNFHAKKILVCRIVPEEYNRISTCDTAKEIWEALQTAHEGTTQVKQSKIDMLTTENKLVRKILSILPSPWESKVNAITESKDLQELTIEELVGNLKIYEMKKKIDSERREPKKEKNLIHKAIMTQVRKTPGHFMKDCPLLKQELSENYNEKAAKRNPVPFKDFKRKRSGDHMVKQALAAWGESSSESEDEYDVGDSSMMAVEGEKIEYDSTLVADRDSLTLELGESEQTRNDLVAVVIDHKETIEIFRKEKNDLLAVIADLRVTIVRPGTKSNPENSGKGKEIASEEHIRLENEVKAMRTRMCVEIEKTKLLQTDLERVKNDLEKSLK
ncbi:PREDICTED: uncharacterized protein LOC109207796 [Nicotiana attenuata]|uniref:uncharacterized protein LOC109207796 n=1 Tax=Nicotiana attenuata TaxID=49451 RepID=UPI00090496C3|nr:PREDICTED: uncharacterized protein LOC109207796 [Nicotiana attenuata]